MLWPALVVAGKVGFLDGRSMTDHDYPVRISAFQSGKTRTEGANALRIEPFLGGRGDLPAIAEVG
jgi:hypothetical protein